MNDQPHDRQLLESATSRSRSPHAPLAGAGLELREAWLAIGRRLDAENAGFREEALLERLRAELSTPQVERRASAASRDRVWPAILASALAIGLLVLLVSWYGSGRRASDPVEVATGNETAPGSAWTDAIDEELAAAREWTTSTASQASGVDDWLANLADHMESLSDDLDTSSL